jgi:hypothetical protein
MRTGLCLLVVALAGCPGLDGSGGECLVDVDCAGDVCARDHSCLPASQVREVHTTWTIRGQAADDLTCAGHADLYIRFHASDDALGFSPVPCNLGQFGMDKLPKRYFSVELGVERGGRQSAVTRAIDTEGNVAIDLEP